MKRSALNELIYDAKLKRQRLDEEITELKDKLKELEASEKKERIITVSGDVLLDCIKKSTTVWKDEDVTDPYHQYRECSLAETCWYGRNMDRLDGLCLERLSVGGLDLCICDVCAENGCYDDVLEDFDEGAEYDIDPLEFYEKDIQEELQAAARVLMAEQLEGADEEEADDDDDDAEKMTPTITIYANVLPK
jgi:chaperonin cofactor prefoldin